MNTIELKLQIDAALPPCSAEPVAVEAQVWVDGSHMEPAHYVDVAAFASSAQSSGHYDIFTCNCGIAGCAGIYEGVTVELSDDVVRWRFLSPISIYGEDGESGRENPQHPKELTFAKDEYIGAMRQFKNDLTRANKQCETGLKWPICDLTTDVVRMNLDDVIKANPIF
ncbi:hypothetical protein [Spongiibacter marinus]|uniref:hypothetical protein n=1 Tax=Spongiibacter marinus TaxID=354246 RepID=UPI0035BE3CE4